MLIRRSFEALRRNPHANVIIDPRIATARRLILARVHSVAFGGETRAPHPAFTAGPEDGP
jgi:hypothetical protein